MDVMNGIKNTLSPKDIDPDMYRVDDVSQKADKQVGTVTTDRLTNILTEYPDACRAFELTTEAGYQKIPDQNTSKSFAGQTNRNEKPLAPLFEELNEYYDCQIRLDTVDPQVIIVTNELTEIHIEIDTSVIQWIPPGRCWLCLAILSVGLRAEQPDIGVNIEQIQRWSTERTRRVPRGLTPKGG